MKGYTMNAYMLSSSTFGKVYMAWVKRYYLALKQPQWTPEYEQAFQQVARMQRMYDSCENGKIVYLWHWHKLAKDSVK